MVWSLGHERLLQSVPGGLADVSESDGLFATAVDDTVLLWRLRGCEVSRESRHSPRAASRIAVSPSGDRIAVADMDGPISVIDPLDDSLVRRLRGHNGRVHDLEFGKQGSALISGGSQGEVLVWGDVSGRPDLRLDTEAGPVYDVEISDDGGFGAAIAADGAARVWNLGSGELVHSFGGEGGWITGLRFLPNGRQFVVASDNGTLRLADVGGSAPPTLLINQEERINRIAISPTGRWLAAASADGGVEVIDLQEQQTACNFEGHMESHQAYERDVFGVHFIDDQTVVSSDASGRVILWAPDCSPPSSEIDLDLPISGLTSSSDGSLVLISLWNGELVALRTDGRTRPLVLPAHDEAVLGAGFVGATHTAATSSWDGSIRFTDVDASALDRRTALWQLPYCLTSSGREALLGESESEAQAGAERCERLTETCSSPSSPACQVQVTLEFGLGGVLP